MERVQSLDDHIYFEDSWNQEIKQEIADNLITPYNDNDDNHKSKKEENLDNCYN